MRRLTSRASESLRVGNCAILLRATAGSRLFSSAACGGVRISLGFQSLGALHAPLAVIAPPCLCSLPVLISVFFGDLPTRARRLEQRIDPCVRHGFARAAPPRAAAQQIADQNHRLQPAGLSLLLLLRGREGGGQMSAAMGKTKSSRHCRGKRKKTKVGYRVN